MAKPPTLRQLMTSMIKSFRANPRKLASQRRATSRFGVNRANQARFAKRNPRSGGFLGVDLKFVDKSILTPATINTDLSLPVGNATWGALNGIAQGDSQFQRIGNKVIVTSIQFNGFITWIEHASFAEQFQSVRFWCGVDHQNNKANPNAAEILDTTTDIMSWRQLDTTHRFTPIKTMTINRNFNATAVLPGPDYHSPASRTRVTFFKKLAVVTQYSGTGDTIGAIVNNAIFCYWMRDRSVPAPQIEGIFRLRYKG